MIRLTVSETTYWQVRHALVRGGVIWAVLFNVCFLQNLPTGQWLWYMMTGSIWGMVVFGALVFGYYRMMDRGGVPHKEGL